MKRQIAKHLKQRAAILEMPKFSLVGSSSKKLCSWQLEVIAVAQINEVFVTNYCSIVKIDRYNSNYYYYQHFLSVMPTGWYNSNVMSAIQPM